GYSYPAHYDETGYLTVYAGVNPKKAKQAAKAVKEVIEEFCKKGVTEEEFLRGREQIKSGSIFAQENTSSQMLLYGKQMLYKNEVYDFEKRMAEIAALTPDDISRAIACNYDFSRAAVATVGNLKEGITL
ncbi:MAG: insulinase family protein, partial [Clostridia bacterium]|nr:insulinase family protein [Clostridia bacterium]